MYRVCIAQIDPTHRIHALLDHADSTGSTRQPDIPAVDVEVLPYRAIGVKKRSTTSRFSNLGERIFRDVFDLKIA